MCPVPPRPGSLGSYHAGSWLNLPASHTLIISELCGWLWTWSNQLGIRQDGGVMGLTGGDVTAMPSPPSEWLSNSLTSPHLILIYTYLIIAKATLKEISSASASYHHPRHVIISQKYMVSHVLLLKHRPEKLLYATAWSERYPGLAPGVETKHHHLSILKQDYYLPASF